MIIYELKEIRKELEKILELNLVIKESGIMGKGNCGCGGGK